MSRLTTVALAAACCLAADTASAQLTVTVQDINPDTSTLDATNPNGASGGRVNQLGVDRATPGRVYAASEWGGLFRSTDNGQRWAHLDGHVPQATWDVEVDPTNSNRVYATSFFDGRTQSQSGINVSTDAGTTWTHPATATPPTSFCFSETRRTEPVAFGIAIDPANASRVFIGTNCGLAMSTDAGVTWTFVDPTPADRARDVWDVVVHDGGIIDVCGDDGHLRSTNNGVSWTTSATQPLPQGRCSLAVSPDAAYVLFAVVGTSIFESDDGGQTWPGTYANPAAQGRIPFIATNQRAGATYDLWFGDVNLFRGTCTTPATPAPGGAQRCNASAAWVNSQNGSHADSGDIAFAPGVASDACPILFSNDGGVFRNTVAASPGCHTPTWDQATVTTHALFNFAFAGSPRAGAPEDLYMGNQDDGSFGTTDAGATAVAWTNQSCCDIFGTAGEATRGVTTVCCSTSGRSTRMFTSAAGLAGARTEINTYPAGNLRGFQHLSTVLNFGPDDYIVGTTSGVFVTLDIGAATIAWTQLGAASTPASACGLQVAFTGATPTFFAKSGGCNGDRQGTLFRYQGTAAGGTWTQVPNPGTSGAFGVFGVDRNDPQHIIASHLGGPGGPRMVITRDGGTTWNPIPALDVMMTGSGRFPYANVSGPTVVPGGASMQLNGYAQPTLVAFDPSDADIVVAAGADSGVFLSTNGGTRWQRVTDPTAPGTSGTPHVPRPFYAHFDHGPAGGDINLFLGTRGRGAWRLTFKKVLMPEIQVPAPPDFGPMCLRQSAKAPLQICNTSAGDLIVNGVTSSDPQFVVTPPSGGFPVAISHDFCFPVQVRFTPTSAGPKVTNLVISSNDPTFPSLSVATSAVVGSPRAVTVMTDTGRFGTLCAKPGAFKDLDVTINNGGTCPLSITGITSSAPAEFEAPQVLAFPITVAPGDSIAVPIRFHPTSPGAKTAAISIATDDPVTPVKIVNVSGDAPPEYVCRPPTFTSIDAGFGPAWGNGQSGSFTVDASGHLMKPFGPAKTFGIQAQGEYLYYSRRQEGQVDASLLYRRHQVQFGVGTAVKRLNVRGEASPGALSHVTANVDLLKPTFRLGAFAAKGLHETDVVSLSETIGLPSAGVIPIVAAERVAHTVDQLGAAGQVGLAPHIWVDGHIEWLHRHAPGVSDTAGGNLRVSALLLPDVAFTAQFDFNESLLVAHPVGRFTIGVTLGRWSKPADYSNPLTPLGTMLPRVHYELFDRVR
jgi:hypothetical protein